MKCVMPGRDLNLIFPFLKWEFGDCLFELFRMTSQGQNFFDKMWSLRSLTSKKNCSCAAGNRENMLELPEIYHDH